MLAGQFQVRRVPKKLSRKREQKNRRMDERKGSIKE